MREGSAAATMMALQPHQRIGCTTHPSKSDAQTAPTGRLGALRASALRTGVRRAGGHGGAPSAPGTAARHWRGGPSGAAAETGTRC